jgi:ABC-type multidrug transport system ATPase subunit
MDNITGDKEPAIHCQDLQISRGAFVLGPVTLGFPAGSLTCIVGPNGSGKTTLLEGVVGLLRPSAGKVVVLGSSVTGRPPQILRNVGYIPDLDDGVIPELTATEFWRLHAIAHSRVRGSYANMMQRADALAETLDFQAPPSRMWAYSHGMTKKTQLVAGLLHDPAIAIFDEPRSGLDPIAIERFDQLTSSLLARGATVLIATHDLRFADRLAQRVVVLAHGQVLFQGPRHDICGPDGDFVQAFFKLIGSPLSATLPPGRIERG